MAWESVPGNDAGRMNGDGSRKLLLHSTEGSTIEGAIGAYRKNNSWPTLTVDCPQRRVVRHLADNVAARSLRNASGGVETNRDGTILIQIELVGFAARPWTIGDNRDLDWFGSTVIGPLCRRNGVPIASTVRWAAYPASYGLGAAQRLTSGSWDGYSGILGHQHAPENTHGDPGAINIGRILAAARGDDDMSAETVAEGVELAVKAGGRARDDLKTLIQGSVLDGLRERTDAEPDRGMLRGVVGDIIEERLRKVLDDRLGPAEPPG